MSEDYFHPVYKFCLSLLDNFPLERMLHASSPLPYRVFFFSFGTRLEPLPGLDWVWKGTGIPADKGFSRLQQSFFWDIPFSAMANRVDGAARHLVHNWLAVALI